MKTQQRTLFGRLCVLAFAFLALGVSAQTTQPATPPSFIVGVWRQPAASLPLWKARGINTVVGTILDVDAPTDAAYALRCRALGLYLVAPCKEADAFEQLDEPDGHGIDPAETTGVYVSAKVASPRPVLLNLDGARIPWTDASVYTLYGAGCDWLGFDYYPLNRGDGAGAIIRLANGLDKLRAAAPGKRYLVFIECSNQQLSLADYLAGTPQGLAARGPTLAEMRQEIDAAVTHGAAGIVYFPDVIGAGWLGFDGTPPDIAAAMPAINAGLLHSGIPPPSTQPSMVVTEVSIDGVTFSLKRKN